MRSHTVFARSRNRHGPVANLEDFLVRELKKLLQCDYDDANRLWILAAVDSLHQTIAEGGRLQDLQRLHQAAGETCPLLSELKNEYATLQEQLGTLRHLVAWPPAVHKPSARDCIVRDLKCWTESFEWLSERTRTVCNRPEYRAPLTYGQRINRLANEFTGET